MSEEINETQDGTMDAAEEKGEEVLEGEVVQEEELIEEELEEIEEDVEILKSKNQELRTALEEEKEQSGKYLKNWQYLQADFQNYKNAFKRPPDAGRNAAGERNAAVY